MITVSFVVLIAALLISILWASAILNVARKKIKDKNLEIARLRSLIGDVK